MNTSRKFWRVSFFVFLLAALCGSFSFPAAYAPVNAAPQMQAGTADLSLTMTVNNAAPDKNDLVVFTITVSNAGPDIATGIVVGDILPAGLVYVSDNSGGTYDRTTGEWGVGTVFVGNSVTLVIRANATTIGTKTNTASVLTSDQSDPDTVLPSSSIDVTPQVANLSLSINGIPPLSIVNVGDTVTFTISVQNSGPDNASGVLVRDLLPVGLTYISHTPTESYNSSTGIWNVGGIDATDSREITIESRVATTGRKVNSAEVESSDQLDPNSTPANGSEDDFDSFELNSSTADLSVQLGVINSMPNKAVNVIFTITVTNGGPDVATGVTVRALLPPGLTWISDDGAYNTSTGIWSVGSLAASGPGSTATLTLTTRATTTGQKNMIAEVWSSNQADPDSIPGNGVASEDDYESIPITPGSADLSLTKLVSGPVSRPGDIVVFTVRVRNDGPDTATNITVQDLLPTGYDYVSDDSGGNYNSATGVWTIASLAGDGTAVLRINAEVLDNTDKTNKAEIIASDQLDPDSTPNNNVPAEDDYDVAPKVDLRLTMSTSLTTPAQGDTLTFTLTLQNTGAAQATGITVRNLLPAGVTYLSHEGGSYSSATGIWTINSLGRQASRTLRILVRARTLGSHTNTAEVLTVDQDDIDSTPGNSSTNEDDDARVRINISHPRLTILINEIAWYGTGASTSDEWIELYNPGSDRIDLSGWILKGADGSPTIVLSGEIEAGGYFLLERTDNSTVIDVPADQLFTGDIENSFETLQLLDQYMGVIDTANANGGIWPAGTTSYNSMERTGVIPDSDRAWVSNVVTSSWQKHDARGTNLSTYLIRGTPGYRNWGYSVTATPGPASTGTRTRTPTRTPSPAPPPPLVAINEFVPRPGHDWNNDGAVNVQDEYVEILNHGTINVNLSGYSLDDEANEGSEPYRLPSITLEPGDRAVFYGSETGLLLSDGGDGVRLLKPNGQLMDAFNYTVARYADQSYCRLPDNGGLDDWSENCFPTPGLQNSLSGDFVEPVAGGDTEMLCPIADTLPDDFVFAECSPYGLNIWRRAFWDEEGWYGEKVIPIPDRRWDVYAD